MRSGTKKKEGVGEEVSKGGSVKLIFVKRAACGAR